MRTAIREQITDQLDIDLEQIKDVPMSDFDKQVEMLKNNLHFIFKQLGR